MKKYLITIMTSLLVILAGCQTNQNVTPSPTTTSLPSLTQSPTQSVSPKVLISKSTHPKQVDSIEADAEDIMDDLNNKAWAKAKSKVGEMKKNLNELKPLLKAVSVSNSLITGAQTSLGKLETTVNNKKVYESKVNANDITRYIPDIADYYNYPLPTDLGRLDYLGREIVLNVENKDWNSAKNNFTKTRDVWDELKKQLSTTYKNDVKKYDDSIAKLNGYISKKSSTSTINEANTLLDLTDVLEKDFSNQKK